MARIRLIHWNGPEGRECRQRLAALGYEVAYEDLGPGALGRALRLNPPDAYVIDLSRLPAQGVAVGMHLRTLKDTRPIPIVFVDGDPEKVKKLKPRLPDATYTTWGRLKTALPNAIARPVKSPIVPPSSIYSGKPTVEKLGVKANMRVCMMAAPNGFANTLKPLPKGATFTAKPAADCELFVVFVRGRRELAAHLQSLARHVRRQSVWFIWPKKASGLKTDVDGNVVRTLGLSAGWVDYKVCSVDDAWSGLAFKRRQ